MHFPRLVYKSASTHILVANEAEHAAALEAGWHDNVPSALGHKVVAPVAKTENLTEAPPAPKKNGKKTATEAPPADPAPTTGAVKNPWD